MIYTTGMTLKISLWLFSPLSVKSTLIWLILKTISVSWKLARLNAVNTKQRSVGIAAVDRSQMTTSKSYLEQQSHSLFPFHSISLYLAYSLLTIVFFFLSLCLPHHPFYLFTQQHTYHDHPWIVLQFHCICMLLYTCLTLLCSLERFLYHPSPIPLPYVCPLDMLPFFSCTRPHCSELKKSSVISLLTYQRCSLCL